MWNLKQLLLYGYMHFFEYQFVLIIYFLNSA